jgi:hypothetical protein
LYRENSSPNASFELPEDDPRENATINSSSLTPAGAPSVPWVPSELTAVSRKPFRISSAKPRHTLVMTRSGEKFLTHPKDIFSPYLG